MNNLLDLITLKSLKGGRTQITIVLFGIVNILTQLGVLHLTPEQLVQINQTLTWVGTYFFADKLSK